ncbi:hypothetical protein [Altererythrobacter aquiaggeris]|uniref:hypothetical protein n=1 Tax=Aestuarierythrobacter aquiaggeris TaxID=1898396 RepID=UPI0030185BD6
MAVLITFLLGIGNFALHKAVLESGHPLIGRMPWFVHMLGGRASLISEFAVLLAAMLLVGTGNPEVWYYYAGYTCFNVFAAWLIWTRRV